MANSRAKINASKWIKNLLILANEMELKNELELEKRYVFLMLEISKHYKVKLDKKYVCKKCGSFLIPGKNATIRIRKGRIILKCLRCGNIKRYVIKKDQSS
ncbi:MAG: ribonuclease P protein component 4 [Thermoplasmata archaeon]